MAHYPDCNKSLKYFENKCNIFFVQCCTFLQQMRVDIASVVARNSQWEGGLRMEPYLPEAIESLGAPAAPNPGQFLKVTHFYEYFGQNSYFEAITHQLKAFIKQSERTK